MSGSVASAFFLADLHFGQRGPAMDDLITERWNRNVGETDTVYVLGDLGRKDHLPRFRKLHGRKHLIAGNGDDLKAIVRLELFETVGVSKVIEKFLLTHVPVHPSELRRGLLNIHGHTHARVIADHRYVCVSVEQTGFRPASYDALLARALNDPRLLQAGG